MQKNYSSPFQRKLKAYTALAGTALAAVNTVNAQIVYTDINPDSTVNTDGGFYNLDLNNDGSVDFTFTQQINPGGSSSTAINRLSISPLDSNAIAASSSGAYIYPLALSAGDSVHAGLTWNMGVSQSMGTYFAASYSYGNWLGVNNKYVGLRINVAGAVYYGWARLDVTANVNSFTIKDYAYRSAADQSIVINVAAGIRDIIPNEINVYNDNRTIYISSESTSEAVISVRTVAGQLIREAKMNNGSMNILLDDASKGIYLVSVQQNNYTYTKKIIIQ